MFADVETIRNDNCFCGWECALLLTRIKMLYGFFGKYSMWGRVSLASAARWSAAR